MELLYVSTQYGVQRPSEHPPSLLHPKGVVKILRGRKKLPHIAVSCPDPPFHPFPSLLRSLGWPSQYPGQFTFSTLLGAGRGKPSFDQGLSALTPHSASRSGTNGHYLRWDNEWGKAFWSIKAQLLAIALLLLVIYLLVLLLLLIKWSPCFLALWSSCCLHTMPQIWRRCFRINREGTLSITRPWNELLG